MSSASFESISNNSQMTQQSLNSGDSNSHQSEYTYYDSALESQHSYDNSSGTSQPYINNNNNNINNIDYVQPPLLPEVELNLLDLHEHQPEVGGHMDAMHDVDNDDDSMLDPADFIDVDNPNNGNDNDGQLDIESNHSDPHLDIPWGVNEALRTQRDEEYLLSINSTVVNNIQDIADMIPSVSTGPNSCFEAAVRAISAHHISPYYLQTHDVALRETHLTNLCEDMTTLRGHMRHFLSRHWLAFVGQHGSPLMVVRSDGSRLEPFRGDNVTRETVMSGAQAGGALFERGGRDFNSDNVPDRFCFQPVVHLPLFAMMSRQTFAVLIDSAPNTSMTKGTYIAKYDIETGKITCHSYENQLRSPPNHGLCIFSNGVDSFRLRLKPTLCMVYEVVLQCVYNDDCEDTPVTLFGDFTNATLTDSDMALNTCPIEKAKQGFCQVFGHDYEMKERDNRTVYHHLDQKYNPAVCEMFIYLYKDLQPLLHRECVNDQTWEEILQHALQKGIVTHFGRKDMRHHHTDHFMKYGNYNTIEHGKRQLKLAGIKFIHDNGYPVTFTDGDTDMLHVIWHFRTIQCALQRQSNISKEQLIDMLCAEHRRLLGELLQRLAVDGIVRVYGAAPYYEFDYGPNFSDIHHHPKIPMVIVEKCHRELVHIMLERLHACRSSISNEDITDSDVDDEVEGRNGVLVEDAIACLRSFEEKRMQKSLHQLHWLGIINHDRIANVSSIP